MIRIDAHHHLWDLNLRHHAWLDDENLAPIRRDFAPADLVPLAIEAGISRTVLVQAITDPEETRDLLAIAATSELIGGVVGWVDLTGPDVAGALAALREAPGGDRLSGIRHVVQGEADPAWLSRPDVRKGLEAVAEAGLVYDLLTLPHQLPSAIDTVRALPDLMFVVDHLSKPPIAAGESEPWASRMRALAAEPNTRCKLSGMVTEASWTDWSVADLCPYADIVLDAFGPERVMFGSDWPVCLLAAPYTDVVAAAEELTEGLSPAERDEVFGGTAMRTYRMASE